jgi:hypothetical protein
MKTLMMPILGARSLKDRYYQLGDQLQKINGFPPVVIAKVHLIPGRFAPSPPPPPVSRRICCVEAFTPPKETAFEGVANIVLSNRTKEVISKVLLRFFIWIVFPKKSLYVNKPSPSNF